MYDNSPKINALDIGLLILLLVGVVLVGFLHYSQRDECIVNQLNEREVLLQERELAAAFLNDKKLFCGTIGVVNRTMPGVDLESDNGIFVIYNANIQDSAENALSDKILNCEIIKE